MNPLIPVLAVANTPEIFDEVPVSFVDRLTDPEFLENPWTITIATVFMAAIAIVTWLIVRRIRISHLEKLCHDPVYIMREKLRALALYPEKSVKEFYIALASLMREMIGLRYNIGASQRTSRELSQALANAANANLADGALKVIQSCEAAMFSGENVDPEKLLADAGSAFEILVPSEICKPVKKDAAK
jgi:hypothetical protein